MPVKKDNKGKSVRIAREKLIDGEVVAIPTETVYGLAGNIFSKKAIARIYGIKKRPRSNPLIVHVADLEQARSLVRSFPKSAEKLAHAFWPGPLTMILPKAKHVPDGITAGSDTVGIRIPDHPLTLRLLRQLPFPLAAPSANPFTYISPVTATQVQRLLGMAPGYILDGGRCRKGIESTIISFEGGRVNVLRQGAITEEAIRLVLKAPLSGKRSTLSHPGMFKKHYSPRTPLLLTADCRKAWETNRHRDPVLLCFRERYPFAPRHLQWVLSEEGDMEKAAANLYQLLHQLDRSGKGLIIAEMLPEKGIGRAVNDRLRKAASSVL